MSMTTVINYDIDRPSDAWMNAVRGLLAQCFQISDQLGWRFLTPINEELRRAKCASYADWLMPRQKYGGVYYPPVDQRPFVEMTALTAIQAGLTRDHFDPSSHSLIIVEPNQVKELRDLQEAAMREVKKRLRELERDGNTTHSADFTAVDWFGTKFQFKKGLQAESVRVLWEAWENKTPSLSEKVIGEKAGSSADNFRLEHVFKPTNKLTGRREPHPAWGTMIQRAGRGLFVLFSR